MKRFFTIFSLIFFFGSYTSVFSATFSSVADGNWSTNATWGGSSNPGNSTANNVTINDSVFTTNNITIKAGGYLTIKAGGILVVHDLEFSNGSHILIEAGGKLIVNGSLTNKNNSVDVEIDGSIHVDGNMDNGNGGVIFGTGIIDTDGSYTGTGTTFGQTNSNITANTTVNGSGLPVELLYFDYSIVSSQVILNWATSSETNNNYFTIERSTDGISFETIATINGAGNSNSLLTYHFTDKNPIQGTSYYRLKQTDFNGKFEYFNAIACNFNAKSVSTGLINSMVTDNISVNLTGESGNYTITIYNYSGQKVFESVYTTENSFSNLTIPFNNIKGYYILGILAPDNTLQTFRFIKS